MITVHHLNNSRSQRVLWLLDELGVSYEIRRYQRDPNTMRAPPELREVHPLGKSPVLTEPEAGVTVAETGAIIDYVLERYGRGRLVPPLGGPERLRYTYWMYYAEGSAMTPLLLKLIFSRMPQNAPTLLRGIVRRIAREGRTQLVDPELKAHMEHWEHELSRSEWFAGPEFSAADIMMSFPLEVAASRAGAASRPRIKAFLDCIHARPAYRAALTRGGPYDYAS